MKVTRGEKVFYFANYCFMIILSTSMLFPLLFVFGRSFMSDMDRVARPFGIIPYQWDFTAYKFIFSDGTYIFNAYFITIMRTVLGTFFNMFFTVICAYVLSKKNYPLRVVLTFMVLFTMWFNGGLIPNFLLMQSLNLYNNFLVYIIPGLINPWNLLILRNFFMSIPDSLEESAKLDGANDITILFHIIIPLSSAAIATISLFYAVWHWNSWFDALIYVNKREIWPVQVFLREIFQNASVVDIVEINTVIDFVPPAESLKMATLVVSTVPILCVYPFLQKHFVKGVLVGSLKG